MSISNVKNRPNKVAKGFTKHYERNEKLGKSRIDNPKHPDYKEKSSHINSLIVRGTTDVLAGGMLFLIKKIKKEHPIDKGYFKEVFVLSEFGKAKLRNKKII
jgi:hypothetical protein